MFNFFGKYFPWLLGWFRLLQKIEFIHSQEERTEFIKKILNSSSLGAVRVVSFVNAHAFNLATKNKMFAAHLEKSDVVLRDGVGVAIFLRLLGVNPGLNMNGTDLIPEILKAAGFSKIALWGTRSEFLELAAKKIELNGWGDCVSLIDGFQGDDFYLREIQNLDADILILGMGMPRQEQVALMLRPVMKKECLVICGGAILDFMAGHFERAPRFFIFLRLEWLYRFFLEPKRLFSRYIIGNPLFLFRSIIYKLFSRKF